MPDKVPRVYADANVLLAYVANEESRADTVQSILGGRATSTSRVTDFGSLDH